jgi:small subunit ribosomal protein S17e
LGRIRQTYIKRTALEIVEKYSDELSLDFAKNREVVGKLLNIESKLLKNKIAGYVTHLLKVKLQSKAETQAS